MTVRNGRIYLDTSLLVGLFVPDIFSARAEQLFGEGRSIVLVSDFAAAELASAIARRVRTQDLSANDARGAFDDFDHWMSRVPTQIESLPADIAKAATFVRRLDLSLRTPDALHIAITQRVGASLATFDRGMASAAVALGISVESL